MPETTPFDVEHGRAHDLAAAEGEQLARERGRALAGVTISSISRRSGSPARVRSSARFA